MNLFENMGKKFTSVTISFPFQVHRTGLDRDEEMSLQQHWSKWAWYGSCDKCVGRTISPLYWLQGRDLQCHKKF